MRLDKHQLEYAIDQLFNYMEKKGIHIADETKNDIKNELTGELANRFTQDEIENPSLQTKLIGAITSYVIGQKEEFNERLESMKDETKRLEPSTPSLDLKLKAEFKLLKILSALLLLTPENIDKPKLTPQVFSKKVSENQTPHPPGPGEKKSLLEQQLEDTLRNLNGGDNPQVCGEVHFPILGPIFGNLYGFINQSVADPKSSSFMVDSITYNPGKSDPLGLENIIKNEDLSEGIALEIDVSKAPRPQSI